MCLYSPVTSQLLRSKHFTLCPLAYLIIPTPTRLLWEAFEPRSNYMQRLFTHISWATALMCRRITTTHYTSICQCVKHFCTGQCIAPAWSDAWIQQAGITAIATSSFKIVLTHNLLLCGAACYILSSRAANLLFNDGNFGVSLIDRLFCSYLWVLIRICDFYTGGRYVTHLHQMGNKSGIFYVLFLAYSERTKF